MHAALPLHAGLSRCAAHLRSWGSVMQCQYAGWCMDGWFDIMKLE